MSVINDVTSIQEAATKFVSDILGGLNTAATQIAGVDVLWFRLQPDKRSQDVIFQSYTLYGVEDCPLSLKAMYADNSYDDAAITYNIMGINFNVPMTLDIALNTWNEAAGNDGTIPQKGDIVFIPMTRKLMEVVSMQPVKQLGGQLTSYKVNLSIYTPTRNRIVGEQLKESIEDNTTNLMERFGEDIHKNVEDIVDDNQLSLFDSTSKDKQKKVTPTNTNETIMFDVRTIISHDLIIDGHTVARNYYNLDSPSKHIVDYKEHDIVSTENERCLSCWFKINDTKNTAIKNIKDGIVVSKENGEYFIDTSVGSKFAKDENVVIKRGSIVIPGVVVNKSRIKVNGDLITKINKSVPDWKNMPGYAITSDSVIGLLNSDVFNISVKGGKMISISTSDEEALIAMTENIKTEKWYGVIVNFGDDFSVDLYTTVDDKLTNISSISGISNEIYESVEIDHYYINSSNGALTNIRLYNTFNREIDKQLTDLVSYNIRNDHNAIINDSADTYLNKEYKGRQR